MDRPALQTVAPHSGNGQLSSFRQPDGEQKSTRKIAILGKAPSSQGLAPYNDPSWEIWILNTIGYLKESPRWDRQFELHDLELTKAPGYGNYHSWLCQQTKPIYVREPSPE